MTSPQKIEARKITHGAFTIERRYPQAPARVFAAFTEPGPRMRWLIEGEGWTIHEARLADPAKPGATEFSRFSPPGSDLVLTNATTWFDVERPGRVIFAYAMTLGGATLSGSLVTAEFMAEGAGTRLRLTEQGAYLDGNVAGREEGMRELLEALAKELDGAA